MYKIKFNSEYINDYLLKNNIDIILPKSFQNLTEDLEILNFLKTEYAHALNPIRLSDTNQTYLKVFDELHYGNYKVVGSDDPTQVLYEGVSFSKTEQKPLDEVKEPTILDLLNHRKKLQQELEEVNNQIVDTISSSLTIFDEVIDNLSKLKESWANRIDELLAVQDSLDEEGALTVFSELMFTLKSMRDKLTNINNSNNK